MVEELTKVTKLEEGDVVEVDGEKFVVNKDGIGAWFSEYEEPSERERFLEYLENHEQVVEVIGPMGMSKDIDMEQTDVVNVCYEFADEVGWRFSPEKTLEFHQFDGVDFVYMEKRKDNYSGDVFVQVAIPDEDA